MGVDRLDEELVAVDAQIAKRSDACGAGPVPGGSYYNKRSIMATVVMRESSRPRPLSRTEWTIMQLCWKLGRATARQVHDASDGNRDYRTVKTLLDRMAAKGFLRIEKLGRLSLFVPAVSRQRAVSEVVTDFVDAVLERSVTPLYLHLAERDDLSPEEIAFFRRQLEADEEES